MSNVVFDLRYSLRKLARSPGLTFALLLTIALGIGSNISIYGFILGLTKPDPPLASVGRIVSIFGQDAHQGAGPLTRDEYLLLKRCTSVFEWVGAARVKPGVLKIPHQSPIVTMASVTPHLASVLGLSLVQGVVISHQIWGNEFAAGGTGDILINGTKASVIGIAPASLEGLYRDRAVDVWMPMEEETAQSTDQGKRDLLVLARLRQGVSISQATAAIRETSGGSGEAIRLVPYTGMTPAMEEGISRIAMLLRLAAGSVLLIAFANVISLLLGRAFSRSPDRSLRIALGASRARLAIELFWDSAVISIAGGACGLILALWTSHIIPALLFQEDADRLIFFLPIFNIVEICAACIGAMIVCGLVPVSVTSTDHPVNVLRRESAGPSRVMRRVRMGLVVGQMTSCCVLVTSTAVLLAGFHAAFQTSIGRRLGDPILVTVQAQPETGITYFQNVEGTARSTAGVQPVAWTARPPGSAAAWQTFRIEPAHLPLHGISAHSEWLTPESIKLLKMPPDEGRMFGFIDKGCPAVIVNEQAAAKLYGKHTVGRTIQDSTGLAAEVIGVVAGRKESRPTIFYNHTGEQGTVVHRTASAQFRAPVAAELDEVELDVNVVSPTYFEAMGGMLTAGRTFPGQPAPGECRMAMVNHEAAQLYFGGKAAGSAVIDYQGVRTTVIGVVNSRPLGNFQRHAEPTIYFPMAQDYPLRMTLIAQAQNPSDVMLADLRQRIASVPGRTSGPIVISTLSECLSHTAMASLRIAVAIVGASAFIALALSIVGLFSAMGEAARQRRRETAIRIALGAARWRVIGQVLGEGGRLASAAILLGTLGSMAVSRLLARVALVDAAPEWWAWLAAPLALMLSAIVTSIIPARRALIANPARIIREDNS